MNSALWLQEWGWGGWELPCGIQFFPPFCRPRCHSVCMLPAFQPPELLSLQFGVVCFRVTWHCEESPKPHCKLYGGKSLKCFSGLFRTLNFKGFALILTLMLAGPFITLLIPFSLPPLLPASVHHPPPTTWKWQSLSRVRLFATPGTIQAMEFSRPECWSG